MTDAAPWTNADLVAAAGAVLASAGAIARPSQQLHVRTIGTMSLLVGWLALVGALAPEQMRSHWLVLLAVACAALSASWLVSRKLVGHEGWIMTLVACVIALRVPLPTGAGTSMLLAPLYALIAFGAVLLVRAELDALRSGAKRLVDRGGATRALDVAVALLPALATLSLLWSIDREASMTQLAFFLVPFQLLYALGRGWLRQPSQLRAPMIAFVAVGAASACVGLAQAWTRTVWWNDKVIEANRFRPDFRTNSVFFDPNIYGRVLVLAILALVAWVLVRRLRARHVFAAGALLALVVAALWATYSQSSWFALSAALTSGALLTLPQRARRFALLLLAIVVVVGTPIAARALSGDDASGRAQVVRDGWTLARERPIAGWGVGTFQTAAIRHARAEQRSTIGLTASHTTPMTVLAELGLLGAASYLLLLGAAAAVVLARWRRAEPELPLGAIIFASMAIVALVAHSLLYAGFFEDGVLWVALAILASLPPLEADEPDAVDAGIDEISGALPARSAPTTL